MTNALHVAAPPALLLVFFAAACVPESHDRGGVMRTDGGGTAPGLDATGGGAGDGGGGGPSDGGMTSPSPDAEPSAPDAEPRTGLAVLGYSSHMITSVELAEISSPNDRLNLPRDLAFNPERPGELWVVNRADDSTVTYFDVGTPAQRADKRIDPFALHFMDNVSSIAFGQPGRFGTCQESRNTYDEAEPPNDFMGPSLWPSDLNIYAHTNPDAVAALGYDLGSHLDMLHESPLCMGIAWETANVYWTFDGMTGTISRYDFQQDHGPGFDDHSDGLITRFATEDRVTRFADVPSHLELDGVSGLLYIADTGASRIAVLDTRSGQAARTLRAKEPGTVLSEMTGATLATFAGGAEAELVRPSGIALSGGILYVTDNETSRITAFDLEGARIDWLDTGLPRGSLMGIAIDPEGRLYLTDAVANRVLRIAPAAEE